ncbi:MAG: magnesium-translocating P-type ATPase [Mycoplasmoidaceae bacterium]
MSTRKEKRKSYVTEKQGRFLVEQAKKQPKALLNDFETSENGLRSEQIESKVDRFGYNTIANRNKVTWYKTLFEAFVTPFTLILIVIALLSVLLPVFQGQAIKTEEWVSFGIVLGMVVLSGTLNFIQNYKSGKASEKLNEMINTTAAVEREGQKNEIPIAQIVPGDIIHLAAGDMVPADMRLLYAKDLFITQSALTGESEPVEKTAGAIEDATNALYCSNICFMGTTVASGSAYGVAVQTGNSTFLGKVAKDVGAKRPQTSFDKGIKKVSQIILITMVIMCLIIFIIKGLKNQFDPASITDKNAWIESLTFSLAAAIAIIPEMLPMIITLNLTKEAIRFSKQKAIIKNVNAIQTFGAMDVLCTDKTGTLTEDHIVLQEHLNIEGKEDNKVLLYGAINSYHQTGLKNLIDKAIVVRAEQKHLMDEIKQYKKVDEIPFSFERRRMSIIVADENDNKTLITKGAAEEIINLCSKVLVNGKEVNLTKEWTNKIQKQITNLNDNGMRVICVAINHEKLLKNEAFSDEDEKDLMLVGYIALLDPPKMSARNAVKDLIAKGVQVKILTGDNEKVTKFICRELGLGFNEVLLGDDLEKMSYEELKEKVNHVTIFAKLSPEQKANIVRALKENKHVVGYMGDGINDAPAMRAADIAISVDTAVDIAKESADVILLEKDLEILGNGALQGRRTFANIMKYIKISLSSNFGNMLSMLIAALWLPFNPLMPIQIIFMNLFYDVTQLSIPWDAIDNKFLQTPKNWNASSIIKFMVILGPVSTIFDVTTFFILYFGFGYNTQEYQMLFQAGWFIEAAVSQTLIIYVLRSRKTAFIKTNPSLPVVLATVASTIVLAAVPFIPGLNYGLQFAGNDFICNLNAWFWLALLGIMFAYILLAELTKRFYMKVNHQEWI